MEDCICCCCRWWRWRCWCWESLVPAPSVLMLPSASTAREEVGPGDEEEETEMRCSPFDASSSILPDTRRKLSRSRWSRRSSRCCYSSWQQKLSHVWDFSSKFLECPQVEGLGRDWPLMVYWRVRGEKQHQQAVRSLGESLIWREGMVVGFVTVGLPTGNSNRVNNSRLVQRFVVKCIHIHIFVSRVKILLGLAQSPSPHVK